MTHEAPDERHDYIGWSVERFGKRCFVTSSESLPPDAIYPFRAEITLDEFERVKAGELDFTAFQRLYQRRRDAFLAGIRHPNVFTKIALLTTFAIALAAVIAMVLGYIP